MIGTIRKHSKWLWAIIITAIIITFVYWGAQPGKVGRDSGSPDNFGTINGRRITRDDFFEARREIYLRHFFTTGDWPDLDAEQAMRETYFRLFLLRKQQELGIHIGSEAVAKVATNILHSFNQGRPLPLNVFVNQVLSPQGLTANDFARFIRHDLGIQQLVSIAGLGGKLVTPEEAGALYRREHVEVSAQAVFFLASNYIHQTTITSEAVGEFYTNQMSSYRLPDRVQVAYVEFPASNFLAEAEQEIAQISDLAERIQATYERLGGTNFFREAKSPEEAKQTIRDQEVKRIALVSARKKANEFANELFAIEPISAENLGKLSAQKGLSAQLSEPFDRQFPPPNLKVRGEFSKQAFALTADEPFAGPLAGEDAAFVIAINKKLPSEIPSLDQIRQQVTDDYKLDRARSLARQAGSSFAAMLAAGIPNGKSFPSICTEAKVKPVVLPPFSISTRSLPEVEEHASLSQFKQAAFSVAPGKPGEFIPTADGGFVVFVQSKLPLDEAKMRMELPQFINAVRRMRENEAFNIWIEKEAERGLRDTPVARRQPAANGQPTL